MAAKLKETATNVSNETIAAFAIEADQAQREIDEASGRKRAVLKRAKDAGVDTKAMIDALRMKRDDEDRVQIQLRNTIHYAGVISAGLKFKQADLFPESAARPLNRKTQGKIDLWEAEQRGYDTGLNGGTMDDTVFAPGTEAHNSFNTGFLRGQTVIAERMGENAKAASTKRTKTRGKMAAAGDDTGEPHESAEDLEPGTYGTA